MTELFTELERSSVGPRHAKAVRPGASGAASWVVALVVLLAGLLAATARLVFIDRSYELFLDEVTYAVLARNVSDGAGVELYGQPFFLHPGGFFWTMGGLLSLRDVDLPVEELVFWLRPVVAVMGAASVAFAVLITHRVTQRIGLAALAGVLVALDPFLIKFDSRVMLETQAGLFAAAALFVILGHRGTKRSETQAGAGAGALMIGAVLTKEPWALCTVLPTVVLLVAGWGPSRRRTGTALATVVGLYGLYLADLMTTGQIGAWWASKASGVSRLIGTNQETGFNAPDSEPFPSRVLALVGQFSSTYLVLGIGAAVLVLGLAGLRQRAGSWSPRAIRSEARDASARSVTLLVWTACAYAYVAYSVVGGTLEEQTFYVLVTPATVLMLAWTSRWLRRQSWLRLSTVVVAGVVLTMNSSSTWVEVHSTPDDGYRQLLAFLDEEVPLGSRIAVTEDTAQFLLPDYDVQALSTLTEVRRDDAQFVLVAQALVERGYGLADETFYDQLVSSATPVFSRELPTLGRLVLFAVPDTGGG